MAVVLGETEEGEHGEDDQQHGNREADGADERVGGLRHGDSVAVVGAELRAPVPEPADVDLLDALHRAGADHPRPDWRAACGLSVSSLWSPGG